MKISFNGSIQRHQQGGVYVPPYAVYQPIPTAGSTASTARTASSSGSSKDLTDKDLLKMLGKLDGLPSDMAVITSQLQRFYTTAPGGYGMADTGTLEARYVSILNQMKVANFNKKEYDHAYEQVSKNGGINELAINDRGQFFCMDSEGSFRLLTAEELKEANADETEYTPLTNSDLLYRRAQDVSLANNNALLSVVQNGIGIESVTDMIQKALSDLGESENSEEGYFGTPKRDLVRGINDFAQALYNDDGRKFDPSVENLYKYKKLTKGQADNAALAMQYIYSTLPENAKALLKSKSDLTDEGAFKLMQSLVASRLDSKVQVDIDMIGASELTRGASTKTASGTDKDETDLQNSQLMEFVEGVGGTAETFLVDPALGISMSATGRRFGMVTERGNGEPIKDTSLLNMLTDSGIKGIVAGPITYGDQPITEEQMRRITYNNTGVMRVVWPKKADGSVDFSILDSFLEAKKRLDEMTDPTDEDRMRIFQEEHVTDLFLANGQYDPERFGVFLVTEGYTTDKLSGIQDSEFVHRISDRDERKAAADIIQSTLIYKDPAGRTVEQGVKLGDHFYKATIYIPINRGDVTPARLDKQKIDMDQVKVDDQKYEDFYKRVGEQTVWSSGLR